MFCHGNRNETRTGLAEGSHVTVGTLTLGLRDPDPSCLFLFSGLYGMNDFVPHMLLAMVTCLTHFSPPISSTNHCGLKLLKTMRANKYFFCLEVLHILSEQLNTDHYTVVLLIKFPYMSLGVNSNCNRAYNASFPLGLS